MYICFKCKEVIEDIESVTAGNRSIYCSKCADECEALLKELIGDTEPSMFMLRYFKTIAWGIDPA